MRNKSLFLMLAGVCGTVAAVGFSQWMDANTRGQSEIALKEILVTNVSISAEEEITADKLRLETWPADRLPAGASADLSEFEGRFAKVPLFPDEPMVDHKLMNEVEDKVVPKGYTVVSLAAGRDGTVNLVSPGDRVDIRGFFSQGDMFLQDMALDVLTGVKVYGIDGVTKFDPEEPRNRSAKNIQLLIRKADVKAFDFAKKLGEISLTLGSPSAEDATIPEGEPSVAARTFMTDLRDRQEELRLARERSKQEPIAEQPEVIQAAPKKDTFRTTKIVNGRITLYEWTEGVPVPRIISDTGSIDSSTDPSSTAVSVEPSTPTSDDFLRGSGSPFFAPEGGEDDTDD